MTAIFVIFGYAGLFVAGLIVSNIIWPQCPFLRSFRQWQPLVGSLIGFLGVSYAIYLQSIVSNKIKKADELAYEIRVLETAKVDLKNIHMLLNNRVASGFYEIKGVPHNDCITALAYFRNAEVPLPVHSSKLNILADKVSPEAYSILSRVTYTFKSYLSSMRTIDTNQCVVQPQQAVSLMKDVTAAQAEALERALCELSHVIDTTKPKITDN